MDRVIKIRMSGEEHERLKTQAGFESISSYCRRVLVGGYQDLYSQVLNAEVGIEKTVNLPSSIEQQLRESIATVKERKLPEGVAVGMPEKKSKTCAHGKWAGQNCWQCGGKVVVE